MPSAKARLLSPQRLFNAKKGITGKLIVEEKDATLSFDNVGDIQVEYDSSNSLPTALAKNKIPAVAEVNMGGVLTSENLNLSPAKKLLLHWHYRFGHKCMTRVQALLRASPFLSRMFLAASQYELPLCETCQYAKGY